MTQHILEHIAVHIVSYEFLMKPEELAEPHQTLSIWVGYRNEIMGMSLKIMQSNVSRLIRTLERHHEYGNDVRMTQWRTTWCTLVFLPSKFQPGRKHCDNKSFEHYNTWSLT